MSQFDYEQSSKAHSAWVTGVVRDTFETLMRAAQEGTSGTYRLYYLHPVEGSDYLPETILSQDRPQHPLAGDVDLIRVHGKDRLDGFTHAQLAFGIAQFLRRVPSRAHILYDRENL